MIYTCQRCTQSFARPSKKAGYRFCSQRCANLRQIKLTAKKLQPYAEKGLRASYIAAQLNVSNSTLHRALIELGLHRLWALRRFKKCASPMVGPSSANTASAMVISPSVESVALTVVGMNCGG